MTAFPNSTPRCLLMLMFLQLPTKNETASFEVLGPREPILALLDEDCELPCYLSLSVSAAHMELRWFRNTFLPAVLVYRDGRELQDEQMPQYHGRVTLVKDNITTGRVAARIHSVQVVDDGVYGCSFQDKQARGEAFMQLKVAALGSDPHISMEVQEGGAVQLECTSMGWYPEPQVQWRTSKGEKFLSTAESRSPDEEGLFTVVASLILRDASLENVSCAIRNTLLSQEKEVGVSMPASSFPLWIILTAVFGGLIGIGILLIWILYRKFTSRGDETNFIEWELARLYPVDLNLDPVTAHPHILLDDESKCIWLGNSRQEYSENPKRFDTWPCVLGSECFTSGCHYWEVEVEGRTDWVVGVCRENVKRKGFVLVSPRNGFWVIEMSEGVHWALTSVRVRFLLLNVLHRVGIFLNYESGTVSFYNVDDRSHIYTFPKDTFSKPLYPIFGLWSCDGSPLTILSPTSDETNQVRNLASAHEPLLSPSEEMLP